MCGIAGFIGKDKLDDTRVLNTLSLMKHRGPDDASHRSWQTLDGRYLHFLHTRLNIIDLDPRSNQPFDRDGCSIIYNGELYNYLEIKKQLTQENVTFKTSSDTEVLLAAFEHWGMSGLSQCEGMWAFAVYDQNLGTLSLCRDRFGEKPLYVYRTENGLYFGSEPKFIFGLVGRTLPINRRHLQRFLVNGYKSLYKQNDTFFEGMTELPPGSILKIGKTGVEEQVSYWKPKWEQEQQMSFAEAAQGAREKLLKAVELHLRADVPLAFCMSGGVDSLSLIAAAKNVFNYDVHGFTIVNSDARYEEQSMVEHAVKKLGVNHTEIQLETNNFIPQLRQLIRHHDAPILTITYFVQWLLMKSIADYGYKVSMSGTGADELFSGYYDHHIAYLYEMSKSAQGSTAARSAWERHVKLSVRNPYLSNPDLFIEDPSFRDHIYLGASDFATYLTEDFYEPFAEEGFTKNLLRNRMLNELFAEAVPVILHEDDLNAMFFSIENRSPFLDRHLFEFSLTIPTPHLVQDGRAKAVLREAMRGIVPDKILDNRRKVGFNAPIHSLLDVGDPSVKKELLADSPLWDFVRKEKVERLLTKKDLPNSESKLLFNILNIKLFLEEFSP